MAACVPSYIQLLATGDLAARAAAAAARLQQCNLCPWNCRVDRNTSAAGVCRTGARARVSSFGPYMGNERRLTGGRGSGAIVFAGSNLPCRQNREISRCDAGPELAPAELAAIMLELQQRGCHNINLVSPSHLLAPILAAVLIAARSGLRVPLVYNTGGYDAPLALILLKGVVDIYRPDMRYSEARVAQRLAGAANYPAVNRAAVREMHRQVGDLQVDDHGIATRGLLVRHLVLQGGLAGTAEIVRFLATAVSPRTYLDLMDAYRPAHPAGRFPEPDPPLPPAEYVAAVQMARDAGLTLPIP